MSICKVPRAAQPSGLAWPHQRRNSSRIGSHVAVAKQTQSPLDSRLGPWRVRIAKRFDALPSGIPDEVLKELIDYYKAKRLMYQQGYFDGQAQKRQRWERWTRNVSPGCFFLSIIAAFSHFLFEWLAGEEHHENWLHYLAGVFVLLAAALPVLAMGVRTFRAAHEFGRNKLCFEGMSHFLSDILTLVEKPEPTTTMIPLLREAEIALDSEHRAWLRLMIEAEWFG